jgi:hypothetical protein
MCCGKKRSGLFKQPDGGETLPDNDFVIYQYTGEQALSTRGSVSMQEYRFIVKGDIVKVDARDAPGMAGFPGLVRVR